MKFKVGDIVSVMFSRDNWTPAIGKIVHMRLNTYKVQAFNSEFTQWFFPERLTKVDLSELDKVVLNLGEYK